jgi:hypothetical protein
MSTKPALKILCKNRAKCHFNDLKDLLCCIPIHNSKRQNSANFHREINTLCYNFINRREIFLSCVSERTREGVQESNVEAIQGRAEAEAKNREAEPVVIRYGVPEHAEGSGDYGL